MNLGQKESEFERVKNAWVYMENLFRWKNLLAKARIQSRPSEVEIVGDLSYAQTNTDSLLN